MLKQHVLNQILRRSINAIEFCNLNAPTHAATATDVWAALLMWWPIPARQGKLSMSVDCGTGADVRGMFPHTDIIQYSSLISWSLIIISWMMLNQQKLRSSEFIKLSVCCSLQSSYM